MWASSLWPLHVFFPSLLATFLKRLQTASPSVEAWVSIQGGSSALSAPEEHKTAEKSNYLGHTLPPAGHLSASKVHTFFVLLPFMVLVYIKLKGVDDADANLRISGDIKPRDSSLLQGVLLVYHFLIHFRYNLLIHHSLFIFHTDFQSLNKKRNTHMLETHKAYGNWSPTDI